MTFTIDWALNIKKKKIADPKITLGNNANNKIHLYFIELFSSKESAECVCFKALNSIIICTSLKSKCSA